MVESYIQLQTLIVYDSRSINLRRVFVVTFGQEGRRQTASEAAPFGREGR